MRKLIKVTCYVLGFLALLLCVVFAYIRWGLAPQIPDVKNKTSLNLKRETIAANHYRIGNNWLRKNEYGLWEEYVEGEAFERGVITGKLNKELLHLQEEYFVEQIDEIIPSKSYLTFLAFVTRIFNRELDHHFPEENKKEIYGESFSAPDEFNYIAPAYDRMLNYHAAHDIGHALQSLALVGCTSFGTWGKRTQDSSMLIGRNLDFSLGDKFAQDKIVYFCKPNTGHRFAIVTWGGFMGCVSGMNEKGLTVTINAAKSDVPTKATTPIAIIARQILQYAENIDEAFAIAKKHQSFVCETIMIGSASDGKTALIEKSVAKTVLLMPDSNLIICANHYQSDSFKNDKDNIENIATSSSMYRYKRMNELISHSPALSPVQAAAILRNQKGINEKNIGMGNEKAMNQLISHHAVIFQPEKRQMWVSANPYQLGAFVCYNLNKVFAEAPGLNISKSLAETDFTIPQDSFLHSKDWVKFQQFKTMRKQIKQAIKNKESLQNESTFIAQFTASNPEFWETHFWIGKYYRMQNNSQQASSAFKKALTKEIHDTREKQNIEKLLTANN